MAAQEYLTWLQVERGRATNTLAAYRRDLLSYEFALNRRGRSVLVASTADLEQFAAQLRQRGHSPRSVERTLSCVRGLHRFLLEEGERSDDPSADLESTRRSQRLPKALTEEEINLLLGSLGSHDPLARRDRAVLELLYGTGIRISEVIGLDLGDLAAFDAMARVFGKGSKERLVPLGREARGALALWLSPEGRGSVEPKRWRSRADAEAVFLNARGSRLSRQGAYDIVKKAARRVGLADKVSPHVLRHSCATHMLAHGADIRVVQELLGHVSIATTQIYTKVTPEHLRTAYEQAHPRAS